MLADAEVEVAAAEVVRRAIAAAPLISGLVDGARSAEPPTSHGHRLGDGLQHLALARAGRVDLRPAANVGQLRRRARRAARASQLASSSAASSGFAVAPARRTPLSQASRRAFALRRRVAEERRAPRRARRSRLARASRGSSSSARSRRRRAARRAPRRCRARSARRIAMCVRSDDERGPSVSACASSMRRARSRRGRGRRCAARASRRPRSARRRPR